jgi:hypothetical protein
MGRVLPVVVLAAAACQVARSQADTLTLSAGPSGSGTITVNLSLASPTGSEPAAVQWVLSVESASPRTSDPPKALFGSASLGKTLSCQVSLGAYTCLNANVIASGVVASATVSLTVPYEEIYRNLGQDDPSYLTTADIPAANLSSFLPNFNYILTKRYPSGQTTTVTFNRFGQRVPEIRGRDVPLDNTIAGTRRISIEPQNSTSPAPDADHAGMSQKPEFPSSSPVPGPTPLRI